MFGDYPVEGRRYWAWLVGLSVAREPPRRAEPALRPARLTLDDAASRPHL